MIHRTSETVQAGEGSTAAVGKQGTKKQETTTVERFNFRVTPKRFVLIIARAGIPRRFGLVQWCGTALLYLTLGKFPQI